MISSALFCSRKGRVEPQPHDCWKNTMKTVETVISVALFIIAFLAVCSYSIPPASTYTLVWVSGIWALANLVSFVIPFLCRPMKRDHSRLEDMPSTTPTPRSVFTSLSNLSGVLTSWSQIPTPQPSPPSSGVSSPTGQFPSSTYCICHSTGEYPPQQPIYSQNPTGFTTPAESYPSSPRFSQRLSHLQHASISTPPAHSIRCGNAPPSIDPMPMPILEYYQQTALQIRKAKNYIHSLYHLTSTMRAELIEDFERVEVEEGMSDAAKCLKAEKMFETLPYFVGDKSYPFSEFPVKAIPKFWNMNCHLSMTLQVMIHSKFYDYIRWRPFRMPPGSPPLWRVTQESRKTESEKQEQGKREKMFEHLPDDRSVMSAFHDIVENLRANSTASTYNIPQHVMKDFYWWLDRLGMNTYQATYPLVATKHHLEQKDWSILILNKDSHSKVIVKKADNQWYEIDEERWQRIPADYSALVANYRDWEFHLPELG